MDLKPCYIDLPVPSKEWRKINAFFDPPTNSDNLGFVRCRTCYVQFPHNIDEQSKIFHLKTHERKWKDFMERVTSSLNHVHNDSVTVYGDEREREDLRLSCGLNQNGLTMVVRFPRSRMAHTRYFSKRWKKDDTSWNKKVADEYQNNAVGAFQGKFDKPICPERLRC